ncbi:hypothetical protein LJC06_03470 [Bacteroidales bacterium OttesenSCG-928-I14]|nr:hypothetical protein [Bacteroidales bacterium OttesenSCG-928-I14]
MEKDNNQKQKDEKLLRKKRVTIMLNEKELNAMDKHLAKYKITNRSRWFRETLLGHIIRVQEDDYPTLFSENEMRR